MAWKRLAFSGLMEIRALYKENALDLAALDEDLRNEWNRLYENSGVVFQNNFLIKTHPKISHYYYRRNMEDCNEEF